MAAIGTLYKNIIEVSQHFHNGKLLPEVQLLAQQNPVVMDIPWRECNDGTGHLYNLQTALPTVQQIAYGEGTPESKSQKAQERATCTILSGFSTIPRDTGMVGGSLGQLRAAEDGNFAEALRQLLARILFYDNRAVNLKGIYGFASLYNRHTNGPKAKNVFSSGGASANAQTSLYMVNWGPDVYGIFPKGMPAGYTKYDLGVQVKTLSNENQLVVLQTEHQWHVGLVIECWPSVARVCNIEVADALALTNNQAPTSFSNILHKIILARLRMRRPGNVVIYGNDTTYGLFMRIATEKSNAAVTIQQATTQFGQFEELRVFGMPFRRNDQILDTEPVVGT